MRDSGHDPGLSQPDGTGTSHTTKATRYMEEGKTDNQGEEGLKKHNKAPDEKQYGKTIRNGPDKGPESVRAKEQDPHKKKDTQPRSNTRKPEVETTTSEDIMSMVARGGITQREAEERVEELGKKFYIGVETLL